MQKRVADSSFRPRPRFGGDPSVGFGMLVTQRAGSGDACVFCGVLVVALACVGANWLAHYSSFVGN